MCLSRLGQIAYGGLSLVSVGLIVGSIFTPAWRQVKSNLQQGQLGQLPPLDMGLFAFACQRDNAGNTYGTNYGGYGTAGSYNTLNQLGQNIYPQQQGAYNQLGQQQQGYGYGLPQQQQQGTSGTAVTLQTRTGTRYMDLCIEWWNSQPIWEKVVICFLLIALISAVASFVWDLLTICACFCHGSILKPLPGLASTAFICLLVALIIYWVKNNSSIDQLRSITDLQVLDSQSNVSYSFYLACGAAIASLINVGVGVAIVSLADKCL